MTNGKGCDVYVDGATVRQCFDPYVDAPSTPLFALGAGLTYGAAFSVTSLDCEAAATVVVRDGGGDDDDALAATCRARVRNAGAAAGDALVLLFVRDPVVPALNR